MANSIRYHGAAVSLHWFMAIGFLLMAGSGWYMVNGGLPKGEQFDLYQTHKAGGVIMLWAIIIRLAVKFFTTKPPLPPGIPSIQRRMSHRAHGLLYCGLLVIPLAGWVMVSSSPFGLPTFVFVDWLKWPHIPGLGKNKTAQDIASLVHWYTVLTMIGLLFAHVGAVYLHTVKHNIQLIKRMWWS